MARMSDEELTEIRQRKIASGNPTDYQVAERLKEKRQEKIDAMSEPAKTARPADRLTGVPLEVRENRRTRGVPEPPQEPTECPTCGMDDHPMCPHDGVEFQVIARSTLGQVLDRACPTCHMKESQIVERGLGHTLYPLAGLRQAVTKYLKHAGSGDFG